MIYLLNLEIETDKLLTEKEVDDLIEDLSVTIRDSYDGDVNSSDLKLASGKLPC